MTTDGWLLLGAIGFGVAGYVYWKRSAPLPQRPKLPGPGMLVPPPPPADASHINGLTGFMNLPDPSNLPLGTKSADGAFVVAQSRQAGSAPHWEAIGGLGGIFG